MYKTFLVAWREFLAAVLTKGFLLGILLPPVIMGFALTVMPLLMNSAAPKTAGTVAVIDKSGLVADSLKVSLGAEAFKTRRAQKMERAQEKLQARGLNFPMDSRTKAMANAAIDAASPTLSVEILPSGTDIDAAKKPLMDANVRESDSVSQRIALVYIPEAAIQPADPNAPKPAAGSSATPENGHYQLFTAPKLDIEVIGDISSQVDQAIVDARLRQAKLDPAQVRSLLTEPITDTKVVTKEGERKDSGVASIFVPFGFLILLWFAVLVGGQGLLMSTVEEKSSRVMEVLLSAISPMQLMVGKIIGQMAVASLLLGLYATTGVGALIAFSMGHLIDPLTLVYAAVYFVIAFFLMASMMAAVGSAVNDIREAQALMQPIMIVMVIPMMLWMPIGRNPNGLFAQIVSFVPPISPFVMVIRIAGSEKIPFWQIPASMAVGIISMIFMCWATAKIFRIGILMYGKPPNLKTLIKWVRMA